MTGKVQSQSEVDIAQGLQQLNGLINQKYVAVAILRGPEYVIEVANPMVCQIWDRKPSAVLGLPLFQALPELSGQGFEEILEGTYSLGKPFEGQGVPVKLKRHGRMETVYFNFSYTPMRNQQQKITGIIVIATDATQEVMARQEAEVAKAESELERKRLRSLLLQAPALIGITRGPQHIFEIVNDLYMELVVGPREILGKPVAEAIPEVVEQGFIKLLDQVYESGQPFIGNEVMIELDRLGSGVLEKIYFNFIYKPTLNLANQVDGIFVHAVDVTDQVLARQKFENLTSQLEAIYDSLPDGVLIADHNGITKLNSAGTEMLGFAIGQPGIKSVSDMFKYLNVRDAKTGKKVPPGQSGLAKALAGETTQYEVVLVNPKTTREGIFRVATAPIFDQAGKVVSAVNIITDITERTKMERQKDDFISIASHELKTPVTSIKAYSQLLERRFKKRGDVEAAENLGRINAQLNRLTNLIGDLLDVTKIETGKLMLHQESFDFDEFTGEVIESLQLITEKHHIVVQGLAEKQITADKERIRQVFTNLISNAIKYSPDGKKIIVHVSSDNDAVKVCVQDFGIGITPDKRAHVFERFFRVSGPTTETYPGLGLGLYISAEIIRRQGGRIWVEGDSSEGSTFCFSLPITLTK